MKKLTFLLAFCSLFLLFSCDKKADFNHSYYQPEEQAILSQYLNLPEQPDDYTVNLPLHLRQAGLTAGPIERDRALLGRVMFYDKNLSKDGKVSCASCHKQEIGFSDDRVVSLGVNGTAGDRNSIALASVASFVAYYGTDINPGGIPFFWDNRANTAKDQNRGSLSNPKEMNMHDEDVVAAVQQQPYYEPLFKKAYGGSSEVSIQKINESIAEFVNSMGSYRSKFDKEADAVGNANSIYVNTLPGLTASENRGFTLYKAKCASCHSANMGRPVKFRSNNGIDASFNVADLGVGGLSGNDFEKGLFKVPTLRNIALSAPYMHDGRFATLEEVLEHYSTGIKSHPNLDNDLKSNGSPVKMNFTATDKQDLIAFLNTLTDHEFIADKRFSNPFKQ